MPKQACAVHKCLNSTSKLEKYKNTPCEHQHKHQLQGSCGCPLPFVHFTFPKDEGLKREWISRINRKKKDSHHTWSPTKDSVVCSHHFVGGAPTAANPYPSLRMGYATAKTGQGRVTNTLQKVKSVAATMPTMMSPDKHGNAEFEDWLVEDAAASNSDFIDEPADLNTTDTSINTQRNNPDVQKLENRIFNMTLALRNKNRQLGKYTAPVHKRLLKSDGHCLFYTGIPALLVFSCLVTLINKSEIALKNLGNPAQSVALLLKAKYKGPSSIGGRRMWQRKLGTADKILMTLMKLRLALLHKDLADRFQISCKDVSKYFRETVSSLAKCLKRFIIFYTRHQISPTLPYEYEHFKRLRCVIDCTEIFIQRPTDLQLQAATWSNYKHHNTIKLLVAITPQGSVAYISELWGGRASDRHIVAKSSFLNYIVPNDQILADRGFTIKEMLMMHGAELVVPPAAKGKAQMSAEDVTKTKKIANVRIHVERVIQRIKQFRLLSQVVPLSLLPLCDDIVIVCCAITNMRGPIVKTWNEVAM